MVFPETFLPYYPYFSFIDPPYRMGARHLRCMIRPSPFPAR
jgi:aliphatic nitrilase